MRAGVSSVAVIGYGLWQSAFGGDPAVIGRRLRMSGVAATVIGVMPSGFAWPEKTEIWSPLRPRQAIPDTRAAPDTTGA